MISPPRVWLLRDLLQMRASQQTVRQLLLPGLICCRGQLARRGRGELISAGNMWTEINNRTNTLTRSLMHTVRQGPHTHTHRRAPFSHRRYAKHMQRASSLHPRPNTRLPLLTLSVALIFSHSPSPRAPSIIYYSNHILSFPSSMSFTLSILYLLLPSPILPLFSSPLPSLSLPPFLPQQAADGA